MAEERKLGTSEPDTEDRNEGTTADTNRPVALSGNAREHLENQDGGAAMPDRNERKPKNETAA